MPNRLSTEDRVELPLGAAEDESLDSISGVRILQRKTGYRFNLDPILLAHFASESGLRGPAIDLGCGSGIIPLLLAKRFGLRSVTGVEIQPQLYSLAQRNVQLNRCERRIALVNGDLRRIQRMFPAGAFSSVICNPPYRPARNGHQSPEAEKAIARHELFCSLKDVVCAASHLLTHRGTFHVIYPASRTAMLFHALCAKKLLPRVMRLVHPKGRGDAKLVLMTAVKAETTELHVRPPLILHLDDAKYTDEVNRMLEP